MLYTLYSIYVCIGITCPKITHIHEKDRTINNVSSLYSFHKVFHLSLSLSHFFPTPLSSYLTSKLQILLNCVRAVVRFRLAASSVCWDSSLVLLELLEEEEGEEEELEEEGR